MPGKFKAPFGVLPVTEKAKQLVNECMTSGRLTSGRLVREFEQRFAGVMGAQEAVALSSGTDADTLALAVLHDFGAERGDEIIIPAMTFVATGNAVLHAGFTPVFVDIERETLNLDPARIEGAITDRTRAIMPVHLMGKPAEMDTILEIAVKHDLFVIEDAAEAHGARYKDKPVGSLADMAAFSTYAAHIITTIEGGVVTTSRPEFAETLRSLRSHGRGCNCRQCVLSTGQTYCAKRFDQETGEDTRFSFDRVGYSTKMNELEAAIGLGNLENYEAIVSKRRENLRYVLERFDRFAPWLATIREEPHERIGPHAVPIVIQEDAPFTRVALTQYLEENGVETRTLFPSIPTQCKGFAFLGYKVGQFPNAEYVGARGIHFGVHQDLGIEEMEYVLQTLDAFMKRY